ncbi:EscU/YscU/HrcU family type III secretion system export apparatus switch protein [Pontibacillus litoralis]|uniref:Type III secretion exporter n=1 Tax=Pontibacillus litoralis JSM 072002 TaxID=1385512 RepID=A0A0A5GB97_9BACI|nr:EscU/YscU/HrcU family type III secretion system export apparatus switch protein [Pontibacillus litoralis]KGX88463.1 hypothetical protein N784_07290 [Pontibacillus litoralis JSM 072002]
MTEKHKRKEVVALQYDGDEQCAPKVIAKGKGRTADTILELAQESGIPVQEDPTLVKLLGELDINETIPEDLYHAVAEVFAFIYQLDKRSQ